MWIPSYFISFILHMLWNAPFFLCIRPTLIGFHCIYTTKNNCSWKRDSDWTWNSPICLVQLASNSRGPPFFFFFCLPSTGITHAHAHTRTRMHYQTWPFTWVLEMNLRPSGLLGKHFANSHLPTLYRLLIIRLPTAWPVEIMSPLLSVFWWMCVYMKV